MGPLPLMDFDRDLTLDELLTGIDLTKLQSMLDGLLGASYRLVASDGRIVLGEAPLQLPRRLPIRHEIEAVAYLELPVDGLPNGQAAVTLIELLVQGSARYLMASELHLQAVRADYDQLQQQHAALQQSEARYCELSRTLEQRVAEQVKTIEAAQRQLYQAEKMASVGQLAAGVAHEINNPIGFINSNLTTANAYIDRIMAFTRVYKQGPATPALDAAWQANDLDYILEDFKGLLKESSDGAVRVAKIVKDLKDFSNIDHSEEEYTDINECLRSVCNMAHSELARHAEIKLELTELPLTRCYPGHLGQAFLNILLNAAQAVAADGRISIATDALAAGEHGAGEIRIRISDNGKGIPPSDLERVFDPFYTSRDVGQGTGLGLTVCRDIVQAHDGRIDIDSRVGAGTTVTIYLPVRAK